MPLLVQQTRHWVSFLSRRSTQGRVHSCSSVQLRAHTQNRSEPDTTKEVLGLDQRLSSSCWAANQSSIHAIQTVESSIVGQSSFKQLEDVITQLDELSSATTSREDCRRLKGGSNLLELKPQQWVRKSRPWNSKMEFPGGNRKNKKMLRDITVSQPDTRRSKSVDVLSHVSLKYVGIFFKVLNATPIRSSSETSYLCPFTVSEQKVNLSGRYWRPPQGKSFL